MDFTNALSPYHDDVNSQIDKSKDAFHQFNQEGLDLAYKQFNYIFTQGDTLFIAGTQNSQDIYDDIRHVAWWGNMTKTQRYKDAETYLKANPNKIKKLVTHSLGSSVGLALQRNYPEKKYEVVTYGAPVIGGLDPFRGDYKVERYKHIGKKRQSDPIASLDLFAKEVPINSNNPLKLHSYKGYVYDWDNHNIKPVDTKPTVIQPQITTQIPNLVNPIQTDNTYRNY